MTNQMTKLAQEMGRKSLPSYTIGHIMSIVEDDCSAEEKVKDIVKTLSEMNQAWNDKSLPWSLEDAKTPSVPAESIKENTQPNYTTEPSRFKGREWYREFHESEYDPILGN